MSETFTESSMAETFVFSLAFAAFACAFLSWGSATNEGFRAAAS